MITAAVQSPRIAPEPPGDPLTHHLRFFRYRPLQFLERIAREHGDVVRLRFPGHIAHLVSSPEGIKHVLQDNHRAYDKESPGAVKLRSLLGLGLLTSEGDFWLQQRRLIQPAFHRQRLASFATLMVRDAEDVAERWRQLALLGKPVYVAHEMMALTMRIVGEALLSKNLSSETDRVGAALTFAMTHVNDSITRFLVPPEWIPTRANRRYLKARSDLDDVIMGVIQERRRSGEEPGDLLSMLLEVRDADTGEGMSDKQLRDELLTLFLAGHETTANALSWTFYLLDQNPHISERLTSEVRSVLGGRPPTLEDLPRLDYVRMVIDESMRLYPPAWFLARHAREDDEVDGYRIPAGSEVFLVPWVVHRSARIWDDPLRFDPERFRKANVASIHRYAYFPFGGGPRLCIGSSFALMEAQLLLAVLAQKFRPRLMPGTVVGLDPQITLRPANGLPMFIERA